MLFDRQVRSVQMRPDLVCIGKVVSRLGDLKLASLCEAAQVSPVIGFFVLVKVLSHRLR